MELAAAPEPRPTGSPIEAVVGRWDVADPIHVGEGGEGHWTTTNLGEAIPGVQTPLSWTLWSRVTDRAARVSGYRIGGFTRAESEPPLYERDRLVRAFYGRAAIQLEFMTTLGDRMPGTTGEAAAESVFGRVPPGMEFHPSKRRYPIVAWRLPATFITFPRRLRAFTREQDEWWSGVMPGIAGLGLEESTALFVEAARRFDAAMLVQTTGIVSTMQPVFEALRQTIEAADAGDLSKLSGASGGAEMAVIADIWRASRGSIEVAEVIRRHGFHGPAEGELESRVWREDDEPVRRMVELYAGRDESEDPVARDAERQRQHGAAERELLDAIPRIQRPMVRLLLKQARERLPLRGYAKRSFLQAFDAARAAARRAGEHLAATGSLEQPDDVFYLTATELGRGLPENARELVTERRRQRSSYQQMDLPAEWKGVPVPIQAPDEPEQTLEASEHGGSPALLSGLGVSGGTVEGIARVVTDPSFAEVEPDEILVAYTTDPSWSSIMFVSSALVMDIGGALSHTAVVARELEIPCVVNTQTGSKRIRSGDRVRVDGDAGTVEIVSRPAA